jgi:predicted PurR-regulated permease PerM
MLIAGFFSVALLPLLNIISKRIRSNALAVTTLMLINTLVIGGIGLVVYQQLGHLMDNYSSLSEKLVSGFNQLVDGFVSATGINLYNFEKLIKSNSEELLSSGSDTAFKLVSNVTNLFVYLFSIPLYTFFILLYRESINNWLQRLLSTMHVKYRQLTLEFSDLIQNYLKGVLLVMLIMGLMNSFGLLLLDVPYAFALGFMVAACSIIPYIGILLGGSVVLVLSYATQGSPTTLLFIIGLFALIQFIEGNFLTPSIVGDKLNVNPLVAILALLIGGQIWGIVGMILAIPTVATITLFFEKFKDDAFYTPAEPTEQ